MKLRLLENVILKDNEIEYGNQEVLEIVNDNGLYKEVIYYDLIDKRINDYEVVITENTIITDLN